MRLFGEGFGDRHCSTETVSSFLDGALREREMRKVESHLASCSDCALHAEDLKAVVGTLRMMPTAPAPRSFAVPAPVPAFVTASARPWWQPAPVAGFRAMAAAAALALAVVFAGDMSGAIGTPEAPVITGLEKPGQFVTPGDPVGPEPPLRIGEDLVPDTEPVAPQIPGVRDATATQPPPESVLAQNSGLRFELWPLELALLALTGALAAVSVLLRRRSTAS